MNWDCEIISESCYIGSALTFNQAHEVRSFVPLVVHSPAFVSFGEA
jgi:hypothetical protein